MRASSYEEALMVQCMLQQCLRPTLSSASSMVLLLIFLFLCLVLHLVQDLRTLAHETQRSQDTLHLKLTEAVRVQRWHVFTKFLHAHIGT